MCWILQIWLTTIVRDFTGLKGESTSFILLNVRSIKPPSVFLDIIREDSLCETVVNAETPK